MAAVRRVIDVFDRITGAIPREFHGKLEPAQIAHEVLEYRWYISEARGSNVPMEEAVASYVEAVLRHCRDEARLVLGDDEPST